MELNINSPKYYKEVYGIDDEIYRLCQEIYVYFKDKSYSEVINIVGIIPIIAPRELIENGKYKEVKYCSVAYGFADVNLFVDSIKAIKTRGKMDFKLFESDMKKFCYENSINYIS